jgi:glutamate 5-kinase
MSDLRKYLFTRTKKVVIKIGSHVLTEPKKGLREKVIRDLASDVAWLKSNGVQAAIVSSGAVATGMEKLGFIERPKTIPQKQATAAVGQSRLMWFYEKSFEKFNVKVAQVLLTHDDLSDRKRFLNAKNTLFTLLGFGVIPIINENDTVAVEEIKFGDNDYLSALVTNLMEADLLIMLTNADGLYGDDPKKNKNARLIPLVKEITPSFLKALKGPSEPFGTGGMITKVEAAEKTSHFGIPTIIANGEVPHMLIKIFEGEDVGTLFLPREDSLSSRKHWIAFSTKPSGEIVLDEGAKNAIVKGGKSLLPSGILEVKGTFNLGDAVSCKDSSGLELARGLVNYGSGELIKIRGLKTSEIEACLGYKDYDEVIHRDDLVILKAQI